ncbi:MAG: hypothetical protein H7X95_12995, partial [Deltaproteobacteria bacterium]|nr:hypothetical protein [Deltaproteobacteria bacterium]
MLTRCKSNGWGWGLGGLAIVLFSIQCGEEDVRPFGGEALPSGEGGATNPNNAGLVRGDAGATGVLTVISTGTGRSAGGIGTGGQSMTSATGGRPVLVIAGTGGAAVAGTGTGGARSGGAPGTGGKVSIPGTGGMPAMAATGGRAVIIGTGGAVASASGGVTGSGGVSHSGGAPGTGGSTGTTAECQQYMRDYDAEIPAARACKLNGNQAKACAVLVPQKLAGCGS